MDKVGDLQCRMCPSLMNLDLLHAEAYNVGSLADEES